MKGIRNVVLTKPVIVENFNTDVSFYVGLVEDKKQHVLVTPDFEILNFGLYQTIDIEPIEIPDVFENAVKRFAREYRWDWNLTPDDADLIYASVKYNPF